VQINNAYLTVISWPSGFDESKRVESLVECTGMDIYQAKLASRRNTPGVMKTIDAQMRHHVLAAMHARGILCIAPTQDEIDAYPEPIHALGIEQFPDADPPRFVIRTVSQTPWTFTPDQVKLVVWGRLKSTNAVLKPGQSSGMRMAAIAPEVALIKAMSSEGAYISKNIKVKEIMDLHIETDEGPQLVRLIGPRTRIGIVGDDSRPSLLDQTRPIDMVEALMPDALIDAEFHDFDPPGALRKASKKNNPSGSSATIECWAFYSPWIGLIKQAMYGW